MTIIQRGIDAKPLLVALISMLVLQAGCQESLGRTGEEIPEQSIAWGDEDTQWKLWGTGGSSLFAVSIKPPVLDIWQWAGDTMKKRWKVDVGDGTLAIGFLSEERWVSSFLDEEKHLSYFCVGNLNSGRVIDRRRKQQDIIVKLGCGSQNGKHLAAWAIKYGKKDEDDEVRFGLVTPDGMGFDWATYLIADGTPLAMIHRVIPSDDGAYIGVAGWENGVAMIEVAKKKGIWAASWQYRPGMYDMSKFHVTGKAVPLDEVDTKDLAFAPDSKLIYAGGTKGCVYGMKVDTGEVVSKWWASSTGKSKYGHRISTISVSPDGRFVAAGTGPEGQVYLFSTRDGQRRILNHGGSTILITSFSPDSKRLASFAAGQIKIWKLPEEAEKPASTATGSHKQTAAETKPSK
jgi:hypothetical protein